MPESNDDPRTLTLICFDVRGSAARRARVARILEGVGERVQRSVFEAWLSRSERKLLEKRLARVLNAEQDLIDFFPLRQDGAKRVVAFGRCIAGAGEAPADYTVL